MAQLDINGLSKRYGDFYAVREVSLDIKDGEFLVLLGPSGCGKTTTLRMVAGFIEPTAGHVKLGGSDVTLLPPWKRKAGIRERRSCSHCGHQHCASRRIVR